MVICWYESSKGTKVCSASGRRSSKRVPLEDLSNDRRPSPAYIKGDLVGPGGWSVINYTQKN